MREAVQGSCARELFRIAAAQESCSRRCSDNVSQLRLHAVDSLLFARFANAKKAGAGETEELLREAVQWSCSIELLKGAIPGSCSNKINGGARGSVCAQESWSAQGGCSRKPLK